MRKFLAIIICKLTKKICKYFGRGSSFPGQLALKICPDILSRIDLPENIIAVTGSNGKTSTVEMIHGIIENAGMSVAYNYEGSNQIEGVTTLILSNCSNSGRFEKDVLLIEADERYAKYIFSYITPKYYCINNLYRDQMTRNGHPEYVLNDIEKSVHEGEILVLNADDPLVSSLSARHDNEVVWFGIDENAHAETGDQHQRSTDHHPNDLLESVLKIRHIRRHSRNQSRRTELVYIRKRKSLYMLVHRVTEIIRESCRGISGVFPGGNTGVQTDQCQSHHDGTVVVNPLNITRHDTLIDNRGGHIGYQHAHYHLQCGKDWSDQRSPFELPDEVI